MSALVEENAMGEGSPALWLERRSKPRVEMPFRATVQGTSATGEPFEVETALDNLSAGGFYVRLFVEVQEGARLFLVVSMNASATGPRAGELNLEVYGLVRRVEPLAGGVFGAAASFSNGVFI